MTCDCSLSHSPTHKYRMLTSAPWVAGLHEFTPPTGCLPAYPGAACSARRQATTQCSLSLSHTHTHTHTRTHTHMHTHTCTHAHTHMHMHTHTHTCTYAPTCALTQAFLGQAAGAVCDVAALAAGGPWADPGLGGVHGPRGPVWGSWAQEGACLRMHAWPREQGWTC